MKLLAFETATEACSVALWVDGAVHERFEVAPRRHAELALPWAEALLAEAGVVKSQLDAIAVGRGPGAFTGVRLAIAIAQGIALALDRPVVPVSTLQALAAALVPLRGRGGSAEGAVDAGSADNKRILAAIDARMGEVYVGAFECIGGGPLRPVTDEAVGKPDAILIPDGLWHGAGTGFAAADGALKNRLGARLSTVDASALPHASDVARLAAQALERGEAVAPERAEPAYLRDNVALTLVQQQALRSSR